MPMDLTLWAQAGYYLVIDLEATTSEGMQAFPKHEMETIEIGAVLVRAGTLDVVTELQVFVRPIRHPVLLPFCTELTGIRQETVDAAPLFPQAFAELRTRMIANRDGLVVWGSWGDYDQEQLQQDCELHRMNYDMPPHINRNVSLCPVLT
jgi:inhibitor of KinA sporulation pathway (predicted exonuclease)